MNVTAKGGTMRLGKYPCVLDEASKSFGLYGSREISERHRHRYEFNNEFRQVLTEKGMLLAGLSPDGHLVEVVELPGHLWFVGCQFHPEFKPARTGPIPCFLALSSGFDPHGRHKSIGPPGTDGTWRAIPFLSKIGGTFS